MFISSYRVKVLQCHPSYSVFEAAAELRVHLFHLLFMVSAFSFLVLNNLWSLLYKTLWELKIQQTMFSCLELLFLSGQPRL